MSHSSRPELVGEFGMVATTHWLATATGMSVLEAGGNAFDAAVAAGFVMQVVEPHLNGPAGESVVLVWSETDQGFHVVCGQGVMPRAATIERYLDLGLDMIPGTGLLAATVPGAFGAWALILERWGRLRLEDVLGYAIRYARVGVPASVGLADTIRTVSGHFDEHWPSSATQWLVDGKVPSAGSRIRNISLAQTYERLVAEGRSKGRGREGGIHAAAEVWKTGFVADAIVSFCAGRPWMDTTGRPNHGLIDGDDLERWDPTIEDPVSVDFGPFTAYKPGPWSQGPVFLQQLAMLSAFDIEAAPYGSTDYTHALVEVAKLCFADREAWYGDSSEIPDLVRHLLASDYVELRARLIGPTASLDLMPGAVGGHTPRLPHTAQSAPVGGPGIGEPTVGALGQTRGDTCHIDVVDRQGNMVSATPSGGWLQSSPFIPELGFPLTNRGQMFWLEPGLPNSLRPGARPRTTLSPTLAARDGLPWLAFGTPGGDQQDQWSLAFFCSVVLGNLGLQEAIDAPAFHSEHFPSSFFPREAHPGRLAVEDRFAPETLADLERRGHELRRSGAWSLGRLSVVAREADGVLRAAANSRGGLGYAAGR